MRYYIGITSLLLAVVFLSACSSPWLGSYGVNAKPMDTLLQSYEVKDQPHLKIKYSGFEQDLLLYGTFIPMLNSTTGHSLKGRIIRFRLLADRVVMLESPKGHSIASDQDSTILLAEFPIVQSESDGIVIDFARGMNNVFTMRNVHSQAVADKEISTSEQFRAIVLSASFIKDIKDEANVLTISQIAQWRNQKSELISAEFRYFIREYLPSPTFKKTSFGKNRFVQYFSTPPMVQAPTTDAIAYISKWDSSRPITFYISHNTPQEYRQAIKDGLLFWNHVFSREMIKVFDLEPEISAPHPRLNIVQWVSWDNETSAYADMVIDPLTGEALLAQIYVRSGWVIQSAKKLRNQLQELLMEEPTVALNPLQDELPVPSVFDLDEPCVKTFDDVSAIADLVSYLDDENLLHNNLSQLTGDILRAVVAHEMGHALGLRHNLAGSLAGNMSLSQRNQMLKTYLQTGNYEGGDNAYLSSSIMDVFSAADDALMGAQIRGILTDDALDKTRLAAIYSFDKQAIDFGYFARPMKGELPFCTDEDINRYLDCHRWDLSSTPLLFASARLNGFLTQVAILMADTFVSALDPARKGGPLAINDIPLMSAGVFKILDVYLKELYSWFNEKARSVQIETQFAAFGPHNEQAIKQARFAAQREQIKEKGVNDTLFMLLPPFRDNHTNLKPDRLAQIFSAHLLKGIEQQRKTHKTTQFNEQQQEQAHQIAKDFFAKLLDDVIDHTLMAIEMARFDDPDFQAPIEEALGMIAKEIILKMEPTDQTLPKFAYAIKTRELAAQILNPALGIVPDWSFEQLHSITTELKKLMKQYGVNGDETIDLNAMPRERRQWLLEQNRILNTLIRVKTINRVLNPKTADAR